MSKDVHFTPHDTSAGFREDEIRLGVNRVGLLIIGSCNSLPTSSWACSGGINTRYREMHDSNTVPAELAGSLKKKPAEIGDVVWVQGDYAEVLNVSTSKYGYLAYLVRYIERSPLADVPEDWFAGFEVRLIAKKASIEKAADAAGEEIQKTTGLGEDRAKLLDYARRAVIRLSIHSQQVRLNPKHSPPAVAANSTTKPDIQQKSVETDEPPPNSMQ